MAIGRDKLNIALPPLNLVTIQRAKEGLAAARDRFSQATKQKALENCEKLAENGKKNGLSGELRRLVLRSFIHALFRVKVEYSERIPKVPVMLCNLHLTRWRSDRTRRNNRYARFIF